MILFAAVHESASLIGRSGSSAFRLSTTTAISMSPAGSCFSSEDTLLNPMVYRNVRSVSKLLRCFHRQCHRAFFRQIF